MGFYETPLRRLRLARACSALVLAIAFAVIPFVAVLDGTGRILSFVASGVCALAAGLYVVLSQRTPPGKTEYALPQYAPPAEQARMYRRLIWVAAVAFTVLSAFVALDLHDLESGRTWVLLVPIHQHLGFRPTVLAPLALGTLCCLVFLAKLRRIPSRQRPAAATPGPP